MSELSGSLFFFKKNIFGYFNERMIAFDLSSLNYSLLSSESETYLSLHVCKFGEALN